MLVDIYYLGFGLEGGSLMTTVSLILRKEERVFWEDYG